MYQVSGTRFSAVSSLFQVISWVVDMAEVLKFFQLSRGAMEWTKDEDAIPMYVTLNNAVKIPLLGLVTSGGKADKCTQAVQRALRTDYRWYIIPQ